VIRHGENGRSRTPICDGNWVKTMGEISGEHLTREFIGQKERQLRLLSNRLEAGQSVPRCRCRQHMCNVLPKLDRIRSISMPGLKFRSAAAPPK